MGYNGLKRLKNDESANTLAKMPGAGKSLIANVKELNISTLNILTKIV